MDISGQIYRELRGGLSSQLQCLARQQVSDHLRWRISFSRHDTDQICQQLYGQMRDHLLGHVIRQVETETRKDNDMTKKTKLYRQGDVLLIASNSERIDTMRAIPTADGADLIIQEGEITGHAHRMVSRHAAMYRSETDQRYLRVTAPTPLTHEEHRAIEIPPGVYRVTIHSEYQPGELPRQVAD